MPFSIFKRTSGACPVHPPPSPRGMANFCLSWQSLLSPSPLPLLRSPLCTVYIIMLKFVVPHNIFSVFLCSAPYSLPSPPPGPLQPVLLAFWTGTATGIFRLPPLHPLARPFPHLFLHVFLWPRRELAHSSQLPAPAPAPARTYFPGLFFLLYYISLARSRTRLDVVVVVGFFLAILCMNAGVLWL